MTMQLLELAIYSKQGKKRSVGFRPGQVNIVTGGSATGKSAIIGAVDYCLGSNKCRVPAGVIRNSVSWYGLTLVTGSTRMFIGRAGPGDKDSSGAAMIVEGADARSPESTPEANTTIAAVLSTLARKVGIVPNIHVPPEGQTRNPIEATFRHAVRFCFQGQSEIAASASLFHNDHTFENLATVDTLPYFLGAVGDDYLELRNTLLRRKRRHRQALINLRQAESIRGDKTQRGMALLDEAVGAGIVDAAEAGRCGDDILPVLARAAEWSPGARDEPPPPALSEIQDEISDMDLRLRDLSEQIKAAKAFEGASAGYKGEVRRQCDRLESVGLFADGDSAGSCPLCSSPLAEGDAAVEAIRNSLRRTRKSLEFAEMELPRLQGLIGKMEGERIGLSKQLGRKREAARSIISASDRLSRLREQDLARAQVAGRVSLWLEHVRMVDDEDALRSELEEAAKKVDEIESLVDDRAVQKKTDKMVSSISKDMGAMAKTLRLEHRESPVRFDPRKLTTIVKTSGSEMPLRNIGGAQNWLGHHLIVHFALHRHFVEHGRPVPAFLVLDQPSQVYYPKDYNYRGDETGSADALKDEDRAALARVYSMIFSRTKKLHPKFQVIVMDHANLEEKNFRSAVREEWRGGAALVPEDWA